MTVFDRLEAQLIAAHPNRTRRALPRPAPRRLAAFAAAAAAAVAIVVAGLSGGSSNHPKTSAAGSSPVQAPQTVPAATTPVPVETATARISVLNATSAPGLAGRIATDLEKSGLRLGVVENAPLKQAATRIYYRPGGERTAALAAALLKLKGAAPAPASLRPFTAVVVVVGRDRIHGPVVIEPQN
jgi:LytR cell envelope-related transcriptional attenuator